MCLESDSEAGEESEAIKASSRGLVLSCDAKMPNSFCCRCLLRRRLAGVLVLDGFVLVSLETILVVNDLPV